MNGRIAVLGGSKDYTGAPSIAAKAALRTGADLTTIITSEKVSSTVSTYSENFIVKEYEGPYLKENSVTKIASIADKNNVMIIGPGLNNPEPKALKQIAEKADCTLVIDAEAISYLFDNVKNAILTPHKKEARPIQNEYRNFTEYVQNTQNNLIITSSTDEIYIGDKKYECKKGNPGMTVGGTGDALTGIIAALKSQGANLDEAARYAPKINGVAGDLAYQQKQNGIIPQDLIEKIPEAIQRIKTTL